MPALRLLPLTLHLTVTRTFALLALSAACQLALAADHAGSAPKAAAAEAAREAAAGPIRKSRADPLRDPLDVIRERLAHKLGAIKAADAPNPNAVRVVSRTSAPDIAEHAAVAEPKRQVHRKPATQPAQTSSTTRPAAFASSTTATRCRSTSARATRSR